MITIITSNTRERLALSALCEARGWNAIGCDSLRAFRRSLRPSWPKVVVTRQAFSDGYSDDVLATLRAEPKRHAKIIVILSAGAASSHEARQLALGADCVVRDPVRTDVLAEYLAKYFLQASRSARPARRQPSKTLPFAGATLDPVERKLQRGNRVARLTPREVALARALIDSRGEPLSYEELYEEILGRRFRGDTSNMRVLLGKLCGSAESVGIPLREWIHVIPKSGYRYTPPQLRAVKPRRTDLSAA